MKGPKKLRSLHHWMMKQTRLLVDEYVIEALAAYVALGLEPGSFTRACLIQDLKMANRHAHALLRERDCVEDHLEWVRRNVPQEAWGSLDKYQDWVEHQGLKNSPHTDLNQRVVEQRLKGEELWWYAKLPHLR